MRRSSAQPDLTWAQSLPRLPLKISFAFALASSCKLRFKTSVIVSVVNYKPRTHWHWHTHTHTRDFPPLRRQLFSQEKWETSLPILLFDSSSRLVMKSCCTGRYCSNCGNSIVISSRREREKERCQSLPMTDKAKKEKKRKRKKRGERWPSLLQTTTTTKSQVVSPCFLPFLLLSFEPHTHFHWEEISQPVLTVFPADWLTESVQLPLQMRWLKKRKTDAHNYNHLTINAFCAHTNTH